MNQCPILRGLFILFNIPNIRLFIAFRVMFNSRFYYPVFTVLFLDFGLSVAQFSLLNAVWAVTIVLAEVPSGALADIIGRKRLIVAASTIMLIEIGILCLVPVSSTSLVFPAFLINRILSGLAEAAASGADEALAYDSLQQHGLGAGWGTVLERLMWYQSFGFVAAMSIGAAVYDHDIMNMVLGWAGFQPELTQMQTMRLPLYLTIALSAGALVAAMKMTEVPHKGIGDYSKGAVGQKSVAQAFKLTFQAGAWILSTSFVVTVLLFGMLFDSIIRMVITLSSQYYRLIQVPESLFGIIGSVVAMLGLFVPRIARVVAETKSPSHAVLVTAFLAMAGLAGMSFFCPVWGIIPALITFSSMYFNGFFISYYLNQATASDQRATVLSFKGLLYNLAYGGMGIVYAALLKSCKAMIQDGLLVPDPGVLEDQVFMDTFAWFPGFFLAGLILMIIGYRIWNKIQDLE